MTDVRCRPIDQWIGARTPWNARRQAPYGASWARTLDDLERELDHLGARDVVIGIDVTSGDIRVDGWPKGGRAIPPPVSLTCDSRVGPLRFECDRWSDYRDNLRAIGLTLQRLRLVDEGGVARTGEQYRGWQALPPGMPMPAARMSVEQAAALLVEHGEWGGTTGDPEMLIDDPQIAALYYRSAAKRAHPDVEGGDPELFRKLTEARDLLVGAA